MIDILPVILFIPLLGAICVSLVQTQHIDILSRNCRDVGMLTTGMVFILSVFLYNSDNSIYIIPLIPEIYLNYNMHANDLSKYFILGVTLCAAITVWVSYFAQVTNIRGFMFTVLILEFLAINIFLTENIMILVLLSEIAFYIIVLQIYTVNDRRGAIQLLIMVMLSLASMIAVLSIVFTAKTADISSISYSIDGHINMDIEWWILLVSFVCRLPIFVLDGWYRLLVERVNLCFLGFVAMYPMVIGLYAIMRVHIFMFWDIAVKYDMVIILGALMCMGIAWFQASREQDLKHAITGLVKGTASLVLATLFIMRQEPIILSIYFIVTYAISICGLMAVMSIICQRYDSTLIREIIKKHIRVPGVLLTGILCMGALTFMPLTSGFVSFMGMLSIWSAYHTGLFILVLVAMMVSIILYVYLCYVVFFSNKVFRHTDIVVLRRSEYWLIRSLICIILIQGIFPLWFMQPLISFMYTIGVV